MSSVLCRSFTCVTFINDSSTDAGLIGKLIHRSAPLDACACDTNHVPGVPATLKHCELSYQNSLRHTGTLPREYSSMQEISFLAAYDNGFTGETT